MRLKWIFAITIVLMLVVTGCGAKENGGQNVSPSNDFTTWTDEKVKTFMQEVADFMGTLPAETTSKEEIIKQYETYFTPEMSEKVFERNFVKTSDGWKVPEGDGGYIVLVPGEIKENKVDIQYSKDAIKVTETLEIGLYSKNQYLIVFDEKPLISDWEQQ